MLETLKRKLGEALDKLLMEQARRNPYWEALMRADIELRRSKTTDSGK